MLTSRVLPGIKGYERLAGVIDWLEAAGLILWLPIANCGQLPFSAYTKENAFKLFVFDVGILGALSQLPVKAVLDYDFGTYKGYYAENFVAQTFRATNRTNLACWREGAAEVEFISVRLPMFKVLSANGGLACVNTPTAKRCQQAVPASVEAGTGVPAYISLRILP